MPRAFIDELKAIDHNFHLVWHDYRVLWDSIINRYEGDLEDPRYTINTDYGPLTFGFVLTDGEGTPIPDNSWHLWRLCWPHGWGHIMKLESRDPDYLALLANRLHVQARFSDKYGHKSLNRLMREIEEEKMKELLEDKEEMFQVMNEENSWLMKKAAENYASGHVLPTNPTKDVIFSAPGVSNRSRIIRPITDEEGGIYTGE